jgi:F0F1-type ATP synthase membrane subunit c/vacuolar-type H+-ATPase subunit K
VNIFADAANKVARDSSLHVETQKQTLLSMIFPTGAATSSAK